VKSPCNKHEQGKEEEDEASTLQQCVDSEERKQRNLLVTNLIYK
jgi:hypothetical protein